ncbi:unnamed protein product, partial [marine sediment metagenome]
MGKSGGLQVVEKVGYSSLFDKRGALAGYALIITGTASR